MVYSPESVPLQHRNKLHLARKIWHFLTVMAMFLVYRQASETVSFLCLIGAAILFVPLDFMRQSQPKLNALLVRWFRPIIREHERNTLAGTTYLIGGVFLMYWFFPRSINELTLLLLAIGDPIASGVGIRFGRDRLIGRKTLQGTLGAFVACTVVAALYFYTHALMVERWFVASLLAGFCAAICEAVPVGQLDDNLTFPVLCAGSLWVVYYLFGAF